MISLTIILLAIISGLLPDRPIISKVANVLCNHMVTASMYIGSASIYLILSMIRYSQVQYQIRLTRLTMGYRGSSHHYSNLTRTHWPSGHSAHGAVLLPIIGQGIRMLPIGLTDVESAIDHHILEFSPHLRCLKVAIIHLANLCFPDHHRCGLRARGGKSPPDSPCWW